MVNSATETLESVLDSAMARLARVEHFSAGSFISMPVLYPSGSSVMLEVTGNGGRFFVSDRGGGYLEAELIGGQRIFVREAERIAVQSGIKFDGRDMFVAEADINSMPAVLKIVANCSQLAANICALNVSDKEKVDVGQALYDRLRIIFPRRSVSKDAEIIGSSNHQWRVSALVEGGEDAIVFDAVTEHPTSAVWTAAKFGDLARLESPMGRVAVISSRRKIGDMIGVISPTATSIIEMTASNDVFLNLGVAA